MKMFVFFVSFVCGFIVSLFIQFAEEVFVAEKCERPGCYPSWGGFAFTSTRLMFVRAVLKAFVLAFSAPALFGILNVAKTSVGLKFYYIMASAWAVLFCLCAVNKYEAQARSLFSLAMLGVYSVICGVIFFVGAMLS